MENFRQSAIAKDNPNEKNSGVITQPIKKLKSMVRDIELLIKRGEKTLNIEGLSARFIIDTKSDVYRLNEKFEEKYAKEIINALKNSGENGFAVNVGAAQGFYTIFSALAGNHTLAIEPDPITFNALQANVELNGLTKKIDCMKCAIGNIKGEETLFFDKVRNSAPSFIKNSNNTEEIKVPVFRMDEIIKQNPDILIVDVEGYEGHVLRGMGELRPKEIFIEIHPDFLIKIGTDQSSVKKLLSDMGYKLQNQYKRKGELLCHYTKNK